jgi:hypothetical protein
MEEIMLENSADPEFVLRKIQKQMNDITIYDQGASSSIRIEDQRTCNTKTQGTSGGMFEGTILDFRNDP